jgi:hypothetical protein
MATLQGVVKGTATVGTTHEVASYEISESGHTRQIQRVAQTGPNGENLSSANTQTAPTANTSIGSVSAVAVVSAGAKTGWMITNVSGGTLYWGFHSTNSTTNGQPFFNNSTISQSGPGMFTGDVYVIAVSGSGKEVRVQTW